ncbi:MAG: sigma-70 family RNA polymerase sigma factor [Firmicutes bacterium]|nr:sigma-70 family RNA polymerase sigma factor [Bacillota bacterium]
MKRSGGDIDALARAARGGDCAATDELLALFKPLVLARARTVFIAGGERDDLIQEGMIGLYKAIMSYDPGRAGFGAFASVCVEKQIYTAVRQANRAGNRPLNEAVQLETPDCKSSIPAPEPYESDGVASVERLKTVLSAAEAAVLERLLEGMTYRQIAEATGKTVKSVDNTIGRIKAKLRKHRE